MEPSDMAALTQPHQKVSDKIRALNAAGVSRADIARFLGKRYQHVRNVLVADAQQPQAYTLGQADLSGVREAPAPFSDAPEARGNGVFRLVLREDGSVILPQAARDAMMLQTGSGVMAHLTEDGLSLLSPKASLRRVQDKVKALIPPGVSLADELIADRRREAEREENGG